MPNEQATCTRCNGTGEYHGTRRDGTTYIAPCFGCQPNSGSRFNRYRAGNRYPTGSLSARTADHIAGYHNSTAINSHGDAVQVSVPVVVATAPRGERNWSDFAMRHPAEAAWLLSPAAGDFGASLISGCKRYGGLTMRQMAAVQRNLTVSPAPISPVAPYGADIPFSDGSRPSDAPIPVTPAPAPIMIAAAPVRAAMDAAAASGLRKVRLVLGAVTFKLSGNGFRHGQGMILCYHSGTYYGFIDRHNVLQIAPLQRGLQDDSAAVEAFRDAAVDPQAAARTYGQDTGYCSCCRRLLTDPPSVMAGIGPICIQRFGWH